MNRLLHAIAFLLLPGALLYAQNPPAIGPAEDDTLFTGSGRNFLLIPEVDDGDEGIDQAIDFSATSSNPSVLTADSIRHVTGQTFALLYVTERDTAGTATIRVEASDADGTAADTFDVYVGPYSNPGINFEIHDVVFWQRVVPLDANPAFRMVAGSGEAPYDEIDLPSLQLSVYSDCEDSPPCTGVDFFTALFKGYVIPPVSGDYHFYMVAGDQCSIGLSTDASFDRTRVILYSPSDGRIGTSSGNKEWKSEKVTLEAGKTYAIYGTHWNVHTLIGGIQWEGPGIEKTYIPGEHLAYVYDVEKPSTPGNPGLTYTGVTDLRVEWETATDDRILAGYNVYLNGRQINGAPVTGEAFRADGLLPETRYCLLVTATDMAGNESGAGSTLCTTTYGADATPPSPPDSVWAPVISDLSVRVAWSGAVDGESEIRGYNLYVDGALYNRSELIYGEEIVVKGLDPGTEYTIGIEATDAGGNLSAGSDPLTVTTKAFDPLDTSLSDTKGRLKIGLDPIGRSDGLGVNPDYKSGEFIDDPDQARLIGELEAAAVRWGALTANPLNFSDYIGTGKAMTFGRFMDFANRVGAYTVITCGVEDGTDWRQDPQTFARFLEYLAGPPESEYGAIRVAEGYTASLLEESPGLVFEFGNEVWGGVAHNAQIGSDYEKYGRWCRNMAAVMQSSGYYDPDKIFLVYSGRRPVPSDSYGLHEKLLMGDTGQVDWLAVSGYLGGNLEYSPEIDPGKSELEYYRNGIAEMARNLQGLEEMTEIILQATGDFKPTYMYEANMTTPSYFGRLGQAVVQTDYYASAMERGGVIPTVFHLTGGQWKMVVPAQDYKKTPLFHTTHFFNRICKGTVLRTGLETAASIQTSIGDKPFDPVGCHAYAAGGRMGILLLSRDFENAYTVQIDLPDELALTAPKEAVKYVITGEHYSSRDAVVDSASVTMSDSLLVTVPPYSMVAIGFGIEDPGLEQVPLGFLDYVSATSVSIYAYGTDEFDISGREKRILLVEVEPDSVLSDAVVWSVDNNGIEVEYGLKSYGFEVKGSGTCDGNGTITVRASAWDNPEVYDEVEIAISGQGSDCNVGATGGAAGQLRIYPNPAGNTLFLEELPPGCKSVTLTDLTGRICLQQIVSGPEAVLDLSDLNPGMYHIGVACGEDAHRSTVIKQ